MIKFSEKFSCFYDTVTDEWSESKCNDVNCLFCKGRPDKPSLVKKKSLFNLFKRKAK